MVYFYLENTLFCGLISRTKISLLGARAQTCAACGYSATVRSPVDLSLGARERHA
jgi:hypothetical protein